MDSKPFFEFNILEFRDQHVEKLKKIHEIITTEDELEGFRIIRAILREIANPNRIFLRDAKTYCAILFDNSNRRPICRLRFNNPSRLAIGVLNGKEENIFQISDLTEIYNYASQLKEAVSSYIKPDLTLVGSEDNQGQA